MQRCIRGWWLGALLLLFAAPRAALAATVSLSSLTKLVLVFPLQPLGRPPTLPDAYSTLPVSSWNFTGSSPGFIVVTRHKLAPSLPVLSELMYFPGTFTPPVCSAGNTRHSTMRFWVDMQVSVDIGRRVWGFPKEIGEFAWSDRGVTLTVKGTVVFSANLTGSVTRRYNATPIGTPISSSSKYSSYAPKDWLANLVQGGIRTMQFPLKPPKAQADAADGTAGESTQAAMEPRPAAAGSLPSQGPPDEQSSSVAALEAAAVPPTNPAAAFYGNLVPNLQPLRFPGCAGLLNVAASSVFIEPLAFTGGAAVPRLNRARGVGLLLDTPGEFSQPVQLAC